jgi:four helix bundle protein
MSITTLRIHTEAVELNRVLQHMIEGWTYSHQHSLGDQVKRAGESVALNIAEGYGRPTTGDRLRFLFIAEASLQEIKSCLMVAFRRGIIDELRCMSLARRCTKLSISIIEFGAALLEQDPEYDGALRSRIERRRRWIVKRREERALKERGDAEEEVEEGV